MSTESAEYKSASIEYDLVISDIHGMLDRSEDGRSLLSNLHRSQHQTQAYGNLLKNISAYAAGSYAIKDTIFNPQDHKHLLKRTRELRDGFVFGMTANRFVSPRDDDDQLLSQAVDTMTRLAFQYHMNREAGIQELEGYGTAAYELAFGELSLNPTNSFRWLVSELTSDLYSGKTNPGRFRSGVGLARCALVEVRHMYDQTFAEMTQDFA